MKWQLLALVLCISYVCKSQSAIFKGGSSDGFSTGCYAQANVILNNAIFKGGSNDGFATGCYAQANVILNNTIFKGGSNDGFAMGCYAQANVILNNAIFKGGSNDGFAVGCYAQADVILNNAIFKGGNNDGFAVGCYAQADVILNNAIFNGGSDDGFTIGCYAQADIILNNEIFRGGIADGFAFGSYTQGNFSSLPIELISFTGECLNNNILLKWRTATENNNDYFTIEQSTDATNWQVKTTIAGAGNSTALLHYSFTDTRTDNNISYYRLKQTDYNGEFEYAPLISVENCNAASSEINAYPNPSNGIINISYNGDDELYSIEVFNAMGQKINIGSSNQSSINLSDYSDGIYFIHITASSKIITKKVILKR